MNDALGARMKRYELPYKTCLPPRTYTIVRVDGRCFHTFLRGAEKPFDELVAHAMDRTAAALCEEMSGTAFAYTQSDEISVLLTDFERASTQAWFSGEVQKIASVAASIATATFNQHYRSGLATFDARVFTIPQQMEVANYFIWRQKDAIRNAVSMAARAHFSHKQCYGKSVEQLRQMLFEEKGVSFEGHPARFRLGGIVTREVSTERVTYTDKRTKQQVTLDDVTRLRWTEDDAPLFSVRPGGFLACRIPAYAPDEALISRDALVTQEEVWKAVRGEVPFPTLEES